MFRYVLLNLALLLAVACFMFIRRRSVRWQTLMVVLGLMVALTAVFDPLLIHVDIVRYDERHISGLRWLGAPVEDFAYAIAAAVLLPALWQPDRKGRHV